ncbi:lipase maturation factor 2 [Orussus abietinus]|uniref:lipase maturation factor 2 n=1 Tax=Orussus abietinus TaxID=222816 RepID=UPI0006259BDD|nr:lipase maturation factor 2 [Orussus abietinus]
MVVRYTRNLILRGVCTIYLFAFLSLYTQIPGLFGENGVLPARTQLDLTLQADLIQKIKQKPTLLWIAPYIGLNVEYMMDILCLTGICLSFMGFVSQTFCTAPIFMIIWECYFSLCQIGPTFMWNLWDQLLSEIGFLCGIMAPVFSAEQAKVPTPTDALSLWPVRWLLFRLIFSSGVSKLVTGCPQWWSLNALTSYFELQYIPAPMAWYAHHLPTWILRMNAVVLNVLELAVPFLFFFPNRKVRITAFYLQVLLLLYTIATGNYGFFNLLTICLCVSLLDDQFFHKKTSKAANPALVDFVSTATCILVYGGIMYGTWVWYKLRVSDNRTIQADIGFNQGQFNYALYHVIFIALYNEAWSFCSTATIAVINSYANSKGLKKKIMNTLTSIFYSVVVCIAFAISVVSLINLHPSHNTTSEFPLVQLKQMYTNIERIHIFNNYGSSYCPSRGNERPEVIIEGSNNIGGPWYEYHFLYKPGNVNNSLTFVAPHHPRLDWQMGSAAQGTYHQNPWLMSLAYRLLTGQPEVLALIDQAHNPFSKEPPKYVRANRYHYRFSSWSSGSDRAWWTREKVGEYFPIFSRDHTPLLEYLTKMKILTDKPVPEVNESFKFILDSLRAVTARFEVNLLLWGVITAGCAIIITVHDGVETSRFESGLLRWVILVAGCAIVVTAFRGANFGTIFNGIK